MNRFAVFSFIALMLCLAPVSTRADLPGDVKAVLADKLLAKAQVSIEVVRLGAAGQKAQCIFEHNSALPLAPASNLKVLTSSAILDRLGPGFKFRTALLMHEKDLVLLGDGDPTLGDAEVLKKVGWGTTTVFKTWAEQLKKQNITTVGNIILDDSIFDEQFVHPHWPADQLLFKYVAPIGGANLNANCLDFLIQRNGPGQVVRYSIDPPTRYANVKNTCTAGDRNAVMLTRPMSSNEITLAGETNENKDAPVRITVHDPSMYAATVMAETFEAAGIHITGSVQRDRNTRANAERDSAAGKPWRMLTTFDTPLTAVMYRANKESVNLYAECMCKRLGAAVSNAPGSWENGTAAVGDFLQRIGVPRNEFDLDDGCGLSKENRVSANAMVRVLAYNHAGANFETFLQTLPIAGVDGTLEKRFTGTSLANRVFAKTGFIEGVSSLSGYLKTQGEQWYAFSILINGIPPKSNSLIKVLQEKIVKAVDKEASNGRK